MDGCLVNLITKSSFCNHLSHWDLKAERELLTETSFFPVVVPAVISTPKPHRETLPHDSKTKLHLGADGRVVGVSSNRTRNSGLLGMGWTIASFLVVPILVAERKSPIDALKGSASLLKKTWGEHLVGNFSFGFVFFLLAIPAYLAIALAVYAGREFKSMPLAVASATVGVLYLILLALIQSAPQSIFQAALYLLAGSKLDKSHYPDGLLSDALDYRRR